MSIEFNCGQCGRLLRTGDDTAGRMAQCPECGAQTQVPIPATTDFQSPIPPAGDAGASDSFAPQSAEFPGNRNASQADFGRGSAAGYPANISLAMQRVSGPATCLTVTAILGLILQPLRVLATMMNIGVGAAVPPRDFMPVMFTVPVVLLQSGIGIIMGVIVLIGASKMKGLDNYGFAIAVSIIAMIPCISPCCLLGLPFGIWALVVLSDPAVKSSFKI